MICPTCGHDNLPGNEVCSNCQHDLTPLDRPAATNRVERSLMEDQVQALKPLTTPITITGQAKVREAVALMLERDIGAILVVDDAGKLQGIFSERDLLKKVAGFDGNYERPVSDFMTRRPAAVSKTDTLAYVLHKMDGGGYRHVPVVENGKPIGVLSVRDMLRHITRLCRE
ncbi:MAG: CBS domain-containing protein [Planctomycetes bacterium]|nr:CBS domain-containing protein [Planctomycetota bacterium]